MQVISIDTCPCSGAQDIDWPLGRNESLVEAFRLLSHRKNDFYMDGWEQQLSLAMASCRCCGYVWHHTRPDQEALFEMYSHGKRLKGISVSSRAIARIIINLRRLFRYCTSANRVAALLDYGSGGGRWRHLHARPVSE